MKDRVIIVHLRRPRSKTKHPEDKRSDPFWEFGSFGLTGCHGKNLLHPSRMTEIIGARLAFAQGGWSGMRLVHITPPIKVRQHHRRIEVTWSPSKPFRYELAPLLIDNEGETNFPGIKAMITHVKRDTWVRKFSSRFRTYCEPLESTVAHEMVTIYEREQRSSPRARFAAQYDDVLPLPPPQIDRNRAETYHNLLLRA